MDTTSLGYRIGYEIGSWLPMLVLVSLYLLIWYIGRRRKKHLEE